MISIFCLLSVSLLGQKKDSKANKYYKKAYTHFASYEYEDCVIWIEKTLQHNSGHMPSLNLLSDVYNIAKDFDAELKVYERILRVDSTNLRAHMNSADIFYKTGQFDKATQSYRFIKRAEWLPERYEKLVNKNLKKSSIALEIVSNPKEFNRQLLQGEANSELDEYWPFITPDGKKLFFTRTNLTKTDKGVKRREENIFQTHVDGDSWKRLEKLPKHINSLENEGAQCITQDGKTMFFTVCKTTSGHQGDCNLYYTQWKSKRWELPQKLPSPVNTPFKETQPSISYDGRTLFFSSDRPGGEGGMDIWVTRMNEDSVWAHPVNLGAVVNTRLNEESPFIHPDNKSLYFSSTGHPGLGKGDFFMTRLNGSIKPVNLGFPLNNHEMQLGIYVDLEGQFGYYASVNPDTETGLDIYRFDLPKDVRPEPLKIINGRVIDKVTRAPIANAHVQVYNLYNNEHVVTYSTLNDGTFKFGLPASSRFAIMTDKESYLPHSIHSSVDSLPQSGFVEIPLSPIFKNGVFALQNIFFDFDSSQLKKPSMVEVKYLADFLSKNPSIVIEIGGHTDNVGGKEYNTDLSQKRALAVLESLKAEVGSQIKTRVRIKGYGSSKPVATNDTEEGRSLNRRTEIKILEIN